MTGKPENNGEITQLPGQQVAASSHSAADAETSQGQAAAEQVWDSPTSSVTSTGAAPTGPPRPWASQRDENSPRVPASDTDDTPARGTPVWLPAAVVVSALVCFALVWVILSHNDGGTSTSVSTSRTVTTTPAPTTPATTSASTPSSTTGATSATTAAEQPAQPSSPAGAQAPQAPAPVAPATTPPPAHEPTTETHTVTQSAAPPAVTPTATVTAVPAAPFPANTDTMCGTGDQRGRMPVDYVRQIAGGQVSCDYAVKVGDSVRNTVRQQPTVQTFSVTEFSAYREKKYPGDGLLTIDCQRANGLSHCTNTKGRLDLYVRDPA